jgi:hypothetical protein
LQATDKFDPGANAEAVAELLTSITLGFVAQRAMAGSADVAAHADALVSVARGSSSNGVTGVLLK